MQQKQKKLLLDKQMNSFSLTIPIEFFFEMKIVFVH